MAQTPRVEQMKADSGMRFSETAGVGQVGVETPAVWAGGEPGHRAKLGLSDAKAPRPAKAAPPSPGAPDGGGRRSKPSSTLSRGLEDIGIAAGALATTLLPILVAGPSGAVVPVALAIAGGTAAGYFSYRGGARGDELAGAITLGASVAVGSLAIVGAMAGKALGRWIERTRKP